MKSELYLVKLLASVSVSVLVSKVCMLVVYVEIHTGGCVMIFLSFFL